MFKSNIISYSKSVWDLVRFGHALIFVISFLIGILLFQIRNINIGSLILPLFVILFSEIGSFALNDALDAESDKLNRRYDRPIVRGEISENFAFYLGWFSLILSTILAFILPFQLFLFVLLINMFAVLYDYYLKDIALLGNTYIAFCMAAPFLFAYLFLYNTIGFDPMLVFISTTAFIFGLAREIAKDIMDMEGDSKIRSSKTFPILTGAKKALYFVAILFFISAVYSFLFSILFADTLHTDNLILFSIVSFLLPLYIFLEIVSKKSYTKTAKRIRAYSMYILMFGILLLLYVSLYFNGLREVI